MTVGLLPGDWALPAITATNRAWFTSGEIAVQKCDGCGVLQHPPEEICHSCGGMRFGTETLSPRGTVHSYTIAHYPVHPALAGAVPYAVVLVSLDDAPHLRVVGNMPGTPLADVRIGLAVEAVWEQRVADDGTVVLLPQWTSAIMEHPPSEEPS